MSELFDVIVLGGGPAGGNAALEAARGGLRTLLVEEQHQPGGQVWRAKLPAILAAQATPESLNGDALRTALAQSDTVSWLAARGWQLERQPDGQWRLDVVMSNRPRTALAKAMVLATGAQERVVPVPGWTIPGVMGLAAATALIKQDVMLPGRQTVVAGCGPLVFFVAAEIMRLGGRPGAVVTLNSRLDWAQAVPGLVSRLELLAQGAGWIARLQASGVPIYWQHGIARIEGADAVSGVAVQPVDRRWRLRGGAPVKLLPADSVALGHGLLPAIEASRLAGAAHHFAPDLGGWVPTSDVHGATSVPGLWVCGDAAGILGSVPAVLQGKLSGMAMVAAQANPPMGPAFKSEQDRLLRKLRQASRFGAAVGKLMRARDGLVENMPRDTIVCRCEAISRQDIEREIDSGAHSPNALKSGTRAGMGPCGGRFCSDTISHLIAARTGQTLSDLGLPTARPPLRPVPIGALAPAIDYEALPIPGPAPL